MRNLMCRVSRSLALYFCYNIPQWRYINLVESLENDREAFLTNGLTRLQSTILTILLYCYVTCLLPKETTSPTCSALSLFVQNFCTTWKLDTNTIRPILLLSVYCLAVHYTRNNVTSFKKNNFNQNIEIKICRYSVHF